MGATGISAESDAGIVIIGYLSALIEEQGSISISGEVDGGSPDGFSGFIYGGLRLNFGPAFLNIPVTYHPPNGLGAGINMGVSL